MLELYNTMTRRREEFQPREDSRVKIFTCGPSIYRRPHVGNYRTFLYEDILVRYLEYRGFQVDRVINFTDVEDKMLQEAREQRTDPETVARAVEDHFRKEARLLKIKLPREIARSSTSVEEAARLIKALLDKGVAYWHDGDVFFDPLKYPEFGKLFRLDMSRWPKRKVRFRRDTYHGRRWNFGDFVLWHGYKDGDLMFWDTEIGRGRPSWNIQDPAMISKYLGYQVDINCGGIDNIYRHHDYNIAVLESVSGQTYARYYLHGEHLVVDGKTMSKSRGNIYYPDDILQWGCSPEQLRFFLIQTHYRSKLNLTRENLARSAQALDGLRATIASLLGAPRSAPAARSAPRELRAGAGNAGAATAVADSSAAPSVPALLQRLPEVFVEAVDQDLSVGKAAAAMEDLLGRLDTVSAGALPQPQQEQLRGSLEAIDGVLQVLL